MQEITFQYENKDFKNFLKDFGCIKRTKHNNLRQSITGIFIVLVLFVIISISELAYRQGEGVLNVLWNFWSNFLLHCLPYLLIFLGLFLFVIFIQYMQYKQLIELQKDFPKDITITINEENITFCRGIDKTIQATYMWEQVKDIHNTKNCLLLFISKYEAIVIPKRIFDTQDAMTEYWQFMQKCYEKARTLNK